MGTKVHGLHPWDELTRVSKLQGPRYAAFAFIGSDAPDMLALEEGDVLVCNASEGAIRNGVTNPQALREFSDRGVQLYSCASLHAKILAVRNSAAVGSANASRSSSLSLESVVVSNEREFISDARTLVKEAIEAGTEIDEEYLTTAATWAPDDQHRPPEIVGVTTPPAREDVFFPDPGGRYWLALAWLEEYTDKADAVAQSMRGSKEARQFKTRFTLDTYQVESAARAKAGDVFVLVHKDDEGELVQVWEPAKVVGSQRIPGTTSNTMYLLRYNRRHEENVVSDMEFALREIQTLTGNDPRQWDHDSKAVELSDAQGAELIAALWGESS
jgi:hypothetical protein